MKLEHYEYFRFLTRITKNKPNRWTKINTGKSLSYFVKDHNSFMVGKRNFINGYFISKMKRGVIYGIRVKNKYNGQFHGIIALTRKNNVERIELNWRSQVLNKPVLRRSSNARGKEYKIGRNKKNYINVSIIRKQIYKQQYQSR